MCLWRRDFGKGREGLCVRLQAYPIAVPQATGKRIEAAGLAKIAAGSVMEGMKVVILTMLMNCG